MKYDRKSIFSRNNCGNCREPGHNRATCTEPEPELREAPRPTTSAPRARCPVSASHAEHLLEYSARILAMSDEERAAEDRRHDALGYAAARAAISGRAVGDFGAPAPAAIPTDVDASWFLPDPRRCA